MMTPSTNLAQDEKEKPKSARHRDEATNAHDDEPRDFTEAADVLFARVRFSAQPISATDGEPEGEHRLTHSEHRELPFGAAPD